MLAEALNARREAVLASLRESFGAAWVEPLRVHTDIREKWRSTTGSDYAVTVTLHFPTGLRVFVIEDWGTENWRIRTGG